MTNIRFTSKYGIDLGKAETISISGNKTLSDKILILKLNPITGEYFLEPRDIGIQHGINDTTLILKDDVTNYSNTFLIENIYSSSEGEKTLYTLSIDFLNKKRGMLSIKGKIYAREEQTDKTIHYHVFTTGENISYQNQTDDMTLNRHSYDKMLFIYNDYNLRHVDDVYKDYINISRVLTKYNFQLLNTTVSQTTLNKLTESALPFIEIDQDTDGLFNIHIKCNALKTDTSTINWFGELEVILTAT